MRKRLSFLAVLGGVVACSCVAAVFSSAATASGKLAAKPSGSVSILWPTSIAPPMQAIVTRFEKVYPKVHVVLDQVPAQSIQTVLGPEVAGGNPPDIAYTCAGAEAPYCLGALDPRGSNELSSLSGPWTAGIAATVANPMKVGGKWYGAPLGVGPEGLFYNKAIFSSLHLKVPMLFSQLLSDCKKIAATGKTPIASEAPISTTSYFFDTMSSHLVFYSDPSWIKQKLAGKVSFASSPGWHQVVQDWVTMKNDKCFSADAASESPSEAVSTIASGTAAMVIDSSNDYSGYTGANPKLKLGFFSMPGTSLKQRVMTFGEIFNLDVFKRGGNQTAAKAFINFIEEPVENKYFDKLLSAVSLSDLASDNLPSWMPTVKADAKVRLMAQPSSNYPGVTWVTGACPSLESLLTGQETVAQQLATMDKDF